jgi:CheY-like chemotaxis protein
MPQGGRLTLRTGNVVVGPGYARLHLEARAGEYVRLRVADTGCGIPAEVLPRIFEPFFTTKGPGRGTGLGLAMVFGIVKQHRGWLDCDTAPGRGTRFDVYLPRSTAEQDTTAPAPRRLPPRGSGTVLLVDDEAALRSLGQTILEQHGYRVLLAEDGAEAVEVYRREKDRIDLVVLDLTMPRLSGPDAFRRLLEIEPQVRVLFASGYAAEQAVPARHECILGFISKPYQPEVLIERVAAALEQTGPNGAAR